MVDKTEQSDRTPNPNEKPEICYCSALPKGFDLSTLLYAMAGRLGKDDISSDNFKYRSSRRHDHWDHVWLRSHHAGTDSAHQYRGNLPSGRWCDGWPNGRENNGAGSQCVPRFRAKGPRADHQGPSNLFIG